jgi:hypothetical protein
MGNGRGLLRLDIESQAGERPPSSNSKELRLLPEATAFRGQKKRESESEDGNFGRMGEVQKVEAKKSMLTKIIIGNIAGEDFLDSTILKIEGRGTHRDEVV